MGSAPGSWGSGGCKSLMSPQNRSPGLESVMTQAERTDLFQPHQELTTRKSRHH